MFFCLFVCVPPIGLLGVISSFLFIIEKVCIIFARWGSIPQQSWCLVTLMFYGEPSPKALHFQPWVGLVV